MIGCRSKYYRVSLKSREEKAIYDLVLSALEKRKTDVEIGAEHFAGTQCPLEDIIRFVMMDNPGLFYVNFRAYSIYTYSPSGRKKVVFSFLYEPDEIDRVEEKLCRMIRGIVAAGTGQGLSGYGMELFLHDYLAIHTRYEEQDKSYHKAHSSVGPLLYGRSVCEGYAMAFKLLCDAAGISCIVVFGDSVQPGESQGSSGHAWNIVKLAGKCYQVDVTWDSCRTDGTDVDHTYFNITDTDLAVNHAWERKLLPECHAEEENYFVRSGTLLEDVKELEKKLAAGLRRGKKQFCFRLRKVPREEQLLQAFRNAFTGAIPCRTDGLSYTYSFQEEHRVIRMSVG